MRLHLVISRHGLPITRILWTTTTSPGSGPASVGNGNGYAQQRSGAIASTRTPHLALAGGGGGSSGIGGYTVAQLLEDVNDVVPLETEPSMFDLDPEFSGTWGLEDYVVEVDGSECLHFMEIGGLLRDGDEVVIRSLELADLRARRLCGRHQITPEGRHLIDGVPFGSPFSKRSTATRPTITIPPRKKRRTVFSGWEGVPGYANEEEMNADEEGDGEWLPPNAGFGKELSILPADPEVSEMGTVIRHPIDHGRDHSVDEEDSDADADADEDISEPEEAELESELKALKADFDEPASQFIDIRNHGQLANPAIPGTGPALRSSLVDKRPSSADSLRRGSVAGASSLSSKRSRVDELSPRNSKAVRFSQGGESEHPLSPSQIEKGAAESSESEAESTHSSSKKSSVASDSDSSDSDSSDEKMSDASSDSSDSSSDSSSDESSDDSSDSEGEEDKVSQKKAHVMAPPGKGSIRTKKSNARFKLRRRLSKLKELGLLPAEADFAALRSVTEANGGWHFDESSMISTPTSKEEPAKPKLSKAEKKEQEQAEFEARRQKLLRDLSSGGVAVDETSEKENVPPATTNEASPEDENERPEEQSSRRRTLDIGSSRRLLFGSLGVRTPKSKEDEESTRQKLAAQASAVNSRRKSSQKGPPKPEETAVDDDDDDDEEIDWESKLDISATECIYTDINLTAPPFPFKNRWDKEADQILRERMGWGKKRKRKQRIQVYNEYYGDEEYDEEGYAYEEGYNDYDESNMELNYEEEPAHDADADAENWNEHEHENQQTVTAADVDDLPIFPTDPSTIADLLEDETKPGSIIAFRQLDMSKATNWQPRMSEYRVAEVHEVLDGGILKVRLALRDRRPTVDAAGEDDGPRLYDGFETPGMDEDEDDGYRDLAFAELSEPKLLRPAQLENEDPPVEMGNGVVREGSIVSVVQDSMPDTYAHLAVALPSAPPVDMDMDLDDPNPSTTTFVTGAGVAGNLPNTPGRTSDVPSVQTPGGVRLPRTEDVDEEHSDSAPVPSPSFSGFHSHSHSARSSPGAGISIRLNEADEESHLEGHTLIDEQQSMLGHTLIGEPSMLGDSNQDGSALSFASASINQSHIPPSGQITSINDYSLLVPSHQFGGDSSQNSLLASLHAPETESGNDDDNEHGADSGVALGEVEVEVGVDVELEPAAETRPTPGGDGPQDDEVLPDFNFGQTPDEDTLLHGESSLHLSPSPSHSHSHSRSPSLSSRQLPTSAQQEPESNSSPGSDPAIGKYSHSPSPLLKSLTPPAASTRSRKRSSQAQGSASQSQSQGQDQDQDQDQASAPPPSQVQASQVFDYIDLTQTSSPILPPRDTSTPRLAATDHTEAISTNDTETPYRPRRTRASSKAQLLQLSSQSPSKIPKRKAKKNTKEKSRVEKQKQKQKPSPKKPEWRI
ncbi:hypothetical protein N7481_007220 [Penicillium waksmanii]|uniref:uncharacterized protein n=1 Tax=Penicillium waksmanii TaxID=69791 RepID=UPI0025470249|nr:uncharacterized protein N7481_007220 [Penicillium waksmanii]KAJ5979922.1 hypothetical protein N7481_007220 [Penicillium waksmanii]